MTNEPVADHGLEGVTTHEATPAEAALHGQLQEIFGRVNEAFPLYEELGHLDGILTGISSSVANGIPSSEVERRRHIYGLNALPKEEPVTFWAILLNAWKDYMIIILAIAAVLSLILGLTVPEPGHDEPDRKKGWIEGVAILISIFTVTTVSSVNDYRKELKFRKLTEANEAQAVVVKRDGVLTHIDVTEIVVGDILNINAGLVVPTDGLYVHGQTVVIDESAVTGENDPKKKNPKAPFILSGTVVNTAEDGWMLVCAVGETSFGGKLLMGSRGEGGIPATPLQERLDDMAVTIGYFGMITALLLFIILGIWEGVRLGKDDGSGSGKRYLDYFLVSVAIVVVAVPEGLPLAVTISLAYSQSMMLKDNNQVRRLKACETMGNATQICSDKTGTLTQNFMSVVQLYITGKHHRITKPGEFLEKIDFPECNPEVLDLLTQALCLCSSSVKSWKTVSIEGLPDEEKWVWDLDKGNKTDNALLDLADRIRLQPGDPNLNESLPHQRVRRETADKVQVFPFTSERKRMSVILDEGDHQLLFVKGGSDVVFSLCDTILNDQGKVVNMDDATAADLDQVITSFADEANRTVGIAFAKLPKGVMPDEEPNVALTWIGLVGIQDPLRPEVTPAVEKCQHAGVTVRMCTGDNLHTAIAISKQCGIYRDGDVAMEGKTFRKLVYDAYEKEMNDENGQEELGEILKKITVVARCQPLDKQLLVLSLMLRGEVVAVTGDGTNDAPALKLASRIGQRSEGRGWRRNLGVR